MNAITQTNIEGLTLRFAQERDLDTVFAMIQELAQYENLSDQLTATPQLIHDALFKRQAVEAVIAEYHGEPVGYALFFHNFSSFAGHLGLYIEDLYVKPKARNKGFGKTIFAFLAKLASERCCKRLDWAVLNWNTPSIAFYKNLGAKAVDEWLLYRLDGAALDRLARGWV
ncbi:MAG: GNAT family N-acetyltransferase [Candidatus Bathyarchaeota archaeon]|nr:GNAT family N-acetyltransferase [Candidatus Bathyarchaeota archaeon]